MMTMRLHRLHFSSRRWPRTFAMSWPHSQRVSDASMIVSGRGPDISQSSLILRTIIKIVVSIGKSGLPVKMPLREWLFPFGRLDAV